jgi:hypothetical protein
MKFSVLFLASLFLLGCTSPKKVTTEFLNNLESNNLEANVLLTSGKVRNDIIHQIISSTNIAFSENIECEIENDLAECDCDEEKKIGNIDVMLNSHFSLTKENKNWVIQNINTKIKSFSENVKPINLVETYLNLTQNSQCETALLFVNGQALDYANNLLDKGCKNQSLKETKTIQENENSFITTFTNKNDVITVLNFKTVTTKQGIRINSIEQVIHNSPQSVTLAFVQMLADGNCNSALDLTFSSARETVLGTIDSGCEGYETEIIEDRTKIEIDGNSAVCYVTENRSILGESTFEYHLEKVDGNWKISSYKKDMNY